MSVKLQLEEAQSRMLALAPIMPVETAPVEATLGRYLAENIAANRTQPSADLSAMDGYAIGPNRPDGDIWKRVGESRAGTPWDGTLSAGETIRISTGAHMPKGADRVLIQENVQADGDAITLTSDYPETGRHVRKAGFDFAMGDQLLQEGTRLGPAQMAVAISGGHSTLPVRHMPSVAIMDSGDELVSDPALAGPHQIPASNGPMLAAMVSALGCKTQRIGPVADDMDALANALKEAENADILITSGGASVGDHDLIQPALKQWGAEMDFWKVAMKPGKPIMLSTRGEQIIFGLPGNPVSSFVTCFLFVLPFIRKAMGASAPLPRICALPLGYDVPEIGPRREFLRAHWDGAKVTTVNSQDSSALGALSLANCLIDRPAKSPLAKAGELANCYLLTSGGIA